MNTKKHVNADTSNELEITIDLSLYSLNSIKKACYKFTAECAIKLEKINNKNLKVIFVFISDTPKDTKEKTINAFYNEILDQNLREIVAQETEQVRNLILAHAFSKSSLIESQ